MLNFFKSKIKNNLYPVLNAWLGPKEQKLLILLAKMNIERISAYKQVDSLEKVEFQVFSQWGEDGIIQYLINHIDIPNKYFIEFGVENYLESNTRFLLINNNWSGLIIDGSKINIDFIKKDPIYIKYDLTAINSFITRENINELIQKHIPTEDIGLLSIDIDGNDYWVWQAIDVIKPKIVICEYNSLFGSKLPVSIPYQENFSRGTAHYSYQYYGASIAAFYQLAQEKGYDFVGCNSNGINAFFVRKDIATFFKKFTPSAGYIESKVRDSRDKTGAMSFFREKDRVKPIRNMPLINVENKESITVGDLTE